jgi:hypothetical protein
MGSRRLTRKGVIEIQFNWIYVLIVGAIILGFFVILANNIRKTSQESLNFDILNYLDEIFVGIETSSQVEHNIKLPDTDIVLDCHHYTISRSEKEGNSLQNRVVFGPDLLKKEIASYTLYWEMPFKTSFFLFLTSKEVQYVVIDDDPDTQSLADSLVEELPRNMNLYFKDLEGRELISDIDDYNEGNHYKIRFITFDDPSSLTISDDIIGRTKPKDVSLIYIEPETMFTDGTSRRRFPEGYGKTRFYRLRNDLSFERDGSADEAYTSAVDLELGYFNKASLLGAIFSQDAYTYDCNMAKGLTRLSLMSLILEKRIDEIAASDIDPDCIDILNEARESLIEINSNTAQQIVLYDSLKDLYSRIYESPDSLSEYNQQLQRLSCPLIY